MSWLHQLGGLLQQYAGASPQQAPPGAYDDFDQFSRGAPPEVLAHGIAHSFRSDQTPPFASMVGQLFGGADPGQRAGLLNTLLGAVGPQIASQALGGLFGGGRVSPHQAAQISPETIQQLAGMAEQHDPSIIDHLSGFVARQPGLFHTLGAGALTSVLSGMARGHQEGVLPASMDPYGAPADQGYGGGVLPASQDPYGDPADQFNGHQVLDASHDPYGDPADEERGFLGRFGR